MNLKDFQRYYDRLPTRYGDTSFLCKGEVLSDTEEGKEFQYNSPFSCFYKNRAGVFKNRIKDQFGRIIRKSDIVMITNKAEREPILFRMIANTSNTLYLQSIKRPEFRCKAKSYVCMVITDQLSSNIEREKQNLTIAKEKGKFRIIEKAELGEE